MSSSEFDDSESIRRLALSLFDVWGYRFYRKEKELRADDQLIRSKVGWLLGSARKSIELADSDYRREMLPPPSREKPRHEPGAIAGAQTLERLSKAIGALQGKIGSLPVPENDRMLQRYWKNTEILKKLIEWDEILIGQAELLRSMLDMRNGAWLIENSATIQNGLSAITESLRNRQAVLM
jgi:hypothetical protein